LNRNFLKYIKYVIIIIASIIIIDFISPGKEFIQEILHVKIEHQKYYNAAKNSHKTFRLKTIKHEFYNNSDSYNFYTKGGTINFSLSPIFKEIN